MSDSNNYELLRKKFMRLRFIPVLLIILGIVFFIIGLPAHFGFGVLGAGVGLFIGWPKMADKNIEKLKEQNEKKS